MKITRTPKDTEIRWWGLRQDVKVSPGKLYKYSFWMKYDNAPDIHIKIIWFEKNDKVIKTDWIYSGPKKKMQDWREYRGEKISPPGARKARFFFWLKASKSKDATLWLDDLSFGSSEE